MAEIDGIPDTSPSSPAGGGGNSPTTTSTVSVTPSRRSTPPGSKRFLLTLTVFFSFVLSLPFLLKSNEIHRSPLPFGSIASLSDSLKSHPPSFLCRFQAVFLPRSRTAVDADLLALSISDYISQRITAAPSSCRSEFTVSATVDSDSGCVRSSSDDHTWQCRAGDRSILVGSDDDVDEALDAVLRGGERVYTVVMVESEEEGVRVVVGKHRHAWIVARASDEEAVSMAGSVFVEFFIHGGRSGEEAGQGKDEFMPVGSDGSLVLSFSLLNANPGDWVYDWDYQKIDSMLVKVVEDLAPVAILTVESQVLYHTPKSSAAYKDDKLGANIFSQSDLPFFVNSNEWHLDTSIAAGGRSKVLQFAVYVPSASECPLLLRLPNGNISKSNGFISPLWGGVAVWNPPNCSKGSQRTKSLRHAIPHQDLHEIFQVFIGQLRSLFGFRSEYFGPAEVGIPNFLIGESGFAKWELDALYRHYASYNLISSATTLESLSNLVQSLPRMIVMDEIGKQVKLSLDAARLATGDAYLGIYDASSASSRNARALAEDAFFHPSLMSISYSSNEHYFAIYMPFFVPVLLHVLLAAIKEVKRFKKERAEYLAFLADEAKTS